MSAPAVRSLQSWAYRYKRTWRGSLVSSVLQPVLFLAAMGLGLGSLVNRGHRAPTTLGGVSYLVFLAPALLAAAAMQTAVLEASWPVLAAVKWLKTYDAMLATPLRVRDLLMGHLTWIAIRVLMVSGIFLAVMAAFGAVRSPEAVLLIPVGVLTGLAFAAPTAAYAVTLERDSGLSALFRFGVIPMFLFSGTFFPVSQLPVALRPVAYVTPLWHGVDLSRHLALGRASLLGSLGHVAYLVVWIVAGVAIANVTYRRRLVH
ncbi:MAG: ABC-type multidrug transport system, permease component [Acidimicrobiales bacterium]|nr:ABC-type multidrug transport system, permease component [Acidimicrobiales bacterium]